MKRTIVFSNMLLLSSIVITSVFTSGCVQKVFLATYGTSSGEIATAIDKAPNNDLYVAGKWGGIPLLLRTDQNGGVVWSKTFSVPAAYFVMPSDVLKTFDQGVIMAGHWSHGLGDIFVVKTNSSGALQWARAYGTAGSGGTPTAQHVEENAAHELILAGSTYPLITPDRQAMVVKLDVNGNLLWAKSYQKPGSELEGHMVKVTTNGDILLVAEVSYQGGVVLIKLDTNGNVLWTKLFEGTSGAVGALALQITPSGYIIGTHTVNDPVLLFTDLNGNLQWAKSYAIPGPQDNVTVELATDGFVLQGGAAGGLFLLKTDFNGIPQWMRQYTGATQTTSPNGHGNPTPVQLSDGGFTLVGNNGPSGTSGILMIRTDKNGHTCNDISLLPTVVSLVVDEYSPVWPTTTLILPPIAWTTTVADPAAIENIVCDQLNCTPPPLGMIAWYPMEASGVDIAGGSNANVGNGSPAPVNQLGMTGINLFFNGVDNFLEAPSTTGLNFGQNDFSIDLWLLLENNSATYVGPHAILDKRTSSSGGLQGYALFVENGILKLQLADGTGSTDFSSGLNLTDGIWHFITVTVDRNNSSGGKWYKDGLPVSTFNPTARQGSLSNNAPLLFAKSSLGVNYFKGNLDEVELFDRILDWSEVQQIYIARHNGKCKSSVLAPNCTVFCANDLSRTIGITVCNYGTASNTYTLQSLHALPLGSNGGSCTVHGPTVYTLLTPSVTVAPGSCGLIQVNVSRPAGMTSPFSTACYEVTLTDNNNEKLWANGCLIDRSDLCLQLQPGGETAQLLQLPAGIPHEIMFQLANPTDRPITLGYRIATNTVNSNLSVLPVSTEFPLAGNVTLVPGERKTLPFLVQFPKHRAFEPFQVNLETKTEGEEGFVQLQSYVLISTPGNTKAK